MRLEHVTVKRASNLVNGANLHGEIYLAVADVTDEGCPKGLVRVQGKMDVWCYYDDLRLTPAADRPAPWPQREVGWFERVMRFLPKGATVDKTGWHIFPAYRDIDIVVPAANVSGKTSKED